MEGVDPIKDKKALNDPMIASKQIKAKKRHPIRLQENPRDIVKETQEKALVPSKHSRCLKTTDPNIFSNTTDLIIAACIIDQLCH